MTRRLNAAGLSGVADGSIYPALARLERASLVESYRVDSPDGPARKYYRRTAAGDDEFRTARQAWDTFSSSIQRVLDAQGESTPRTDRIVGELG
jgi:PadR family transcriptional regulator PadR